MNWLTPVSLTVPVMSLLLLGLAPNRIANGAPRLFGRLTTVLIAFVFVASLATGFQLMTQGPIDFAFVTLTSPVYFRLGIHVDAVAVVMMTLVSFIGLIIARYSARYLLGDPHQGQFFRWMSFTLGATVLLVISCNLVMFTGAWMLTSLGLHQLLTYYPERTWAIWAARKKFLISRVGDVLLITALILTYRSFGTTEYTEIFAAARPIREGTTPGTFSTALIGVLFVIGAMTKSAQFPFHSWLPDTMETPTPVSALMHAGVINAGGFLVIRLSPLVSLSPVALDLLALIGAATALLGSVVMLTQTSIKRSLAYSTIAQMGFMMLQCGLGAFSAAMLHIVAHSVYKAHAFLSSGSVLENAALMKVPTAPASSPARSVLACLAAIALSVGIVFGTFQMIGIDLANKPGGTVLGAILMLALAQLLWNGFATGRMGLVIRSIGSGLLVTATYSAAYSMMNGLVASATSNYSVAHSSIEMVLLALIVMGFFSVFALQVLSGPIMHHRWVRVLYVHAMNGFYIDIPARRLTAKFYAQTGPVQ